jgi:hypothetical protein
MEPYLLSLPGDESAYTNEASAKLKYLQQTEDIKKYCLIPMTDLELVAVYCWSY